MFQPIRGQGGHIGFPIGTRNINPIEGIEYLLAIKFRQNPFRGCGKKSKNVSANQRPGRPSWISDWHEKHKSYRGHWVLACYQVSSKSIQRLRRRSRKMFQPIRGQGGHLRFPIGTKNTNLIEGIEDLLVIKFRQNPFRGCGKKSKNVSANQRPGRPSWISDWHKKHKSYRGHWVLACYQVSSKSIQRLRRRSGKMFQPIRGQGGHLRFPIGTKNTNLIEGIEDSLPVKFRQNPFSSCGEEVEKCFSQSEARAAILDFRSAQKTQTW